MTQSISSKAATISAINSFRPLAGLSKSDKDEVVDQLESLIDLSIVSVSVNAVSRRLKRFYKAQRDRGIADEVDWQSAERYEKAPGGITTVS